jgi:AraC-like DNA-binding protein
MSEIIHSFQGRFARAELFRVDARKDVHTHPHLQMVMRVDGTDTVHRVEGGTAILDDRSVVLVNPWTAHARDPLGAGDAAVLLALYLEPSWIGVPATGLMASDPPRILAAVSGTLDAATRAARDRFIKALLAHKRLCEASVSGREDDTGLEEPLFALLDVLVGGAVRAAARGTDLSDLPNGTRPIDQRIRRAIALMRGTVCKEPGVDAIAVAAGLSRSRFFEQFRDCCGITPRQYADTLLLEEAVRRLTEEETPIAEISDRLGFSAQSHFTRFFRHKTGVSPSQYRRATRPYKKRSSRHFAGLLDEGDAADVAEA